MKKKGQVKFGESFGIIIIVTIVIFLGASWYNSISSKALHELSIEDQEDRAFERYNYIINHNFLRISQNTVIDDKFDLHSFRIFSEFSKTPTGIEYLRPNLGESTIVLELYRYDDIMADIFTVNETIVLYNRTPSANLQLQGESVYRSLIPVRDYVESRTDLGVLTVRVPIVR